jgi:hypothetical protein
MRIWDNSFSINMIWWELKVEKLAHTTQAVFTLRDSEYNITSTIISRESIHFPFY